MSNWTRPRGNLSIMKKMYWLGLKLWCCPKSSNGTKRISPDDILIFLQQYADPSLQQKLQAASDAKYRIRYEDYDWSLNATNDTESDGEQEIDD